MMKKRSTVAVYLPEDLLVEILSRVPAKSLARLRSTSKRWNALFKDGILAKKHSANAPRDSSLVLMVTDFRVHLISVELHGNVTPSAKVTNQFSLKDPLLDLLEQADVCNAYLCDGLLLCITKDNRLVVWNPCTDETRWIQARNEYNETECYALGYDNKSSCYKILHSFNRSAEHNKPEVYDFASNSWSSVCSTTDWYTPPQRIRGMSVKGSTYWLAVDDLFHYYFLLHFDFSTERFQRLTLPADASSSSSIHRMALSLTREERQLCMLDFSGSNEVKDVWIATKMEDTGAVSWSKFRRFHLRINMRVLHDYENKVLLSCNSREIYDNVLYIVGGDKYIHLDYYARKVICRSFLTYVPSLVQI